jgi:hypothetical protein
MRDTFIYYIWCIKRLRSLNEVDVFTVLLSVDLVESKICVVFWVMILKATVPAVARLCIRVFLSLNMGPESGYPD